MSTQILDNKVVDLAIIGGVGYGLWVLKDVIFPTVKLAEDTSKAIGEGIQWEVDMFEGVTDALDVITEGMGIGVGAITGKNDEDANMKFIKDLQKKEAEGNPFIKLVGEIGGGFESSLKERDFTAIPQGSFGDETDAHLIKQRIWADATMIHDRDSIISYNIVAERLNLEVKSLSPKLVSFQTAIKNQIDKIEWAGRKYEEIAPRGFVKGDSRITEGWTELGNYHNITKAFFNFEDFSSFYHEFRDGDITQIKEDIAIGIAGCWNDMLGADWRDKYKKDPNGRREEMIQILDAYEIPLTYFEFPNDPELTLLKNYGIKPVAFNYLKNGIPLDDYQKSIGFTGVYKFKAEWW